jgi:hypothetical protein
MVRTLADWSPWVSFSKHWSNRMAEQPTQFHRRKWGGTSQWTPASTRDTTGSWFGKKWSSLWVLCTEEVRYFTNSTYINTLRSDVFCLRACCIFCNFQSVNKPKLTMSCLEFLQYQLTTTTPNKERKTPLVQRLPTSLHL